LWRQKLFSIATAIVLDEAEFLEYWPYVSNVWTKDNTRERKGDSVVATHYNCRLRRAE
jgi:hypothetical protein